MISDLTIHSDMVDRESILRDWAIVRQNYPVPTNLHDHQIDAMGLLKEGRNVFLGKYTVQKPLHPLLMIFFGIVSLTHHYRLTI